MRSWIQICLILGLVSCVDAEEGKEQEDEATADLDGDGWVDLASASAWDNTVAWFRNSGDGSFGEKRVVTSTASGAGHTPSAAASGGSTRRGRALSSSTRGSA